MKNSIILFILFVAVAFGCSRTKDNVSVTYTPSTPLITISSAQYVSIPVGGALPTVSATSYDTFYKQSLTNNIIIDYSNVKVDIPGFYQIIVSSKNKNGYIGYGYVYVAVTNISSTVNISGHYLQMTNNDTVAVTMLAPGLYQTSNVAGVHTFDSANFITPAYFVQLSATSIVLPMQKTYFPTNNSSIDSLYGTNGSCVVSPPDTTFQYMIQNKNFGPSMRVFKKIY